MTGPQEPLSAASVIEALAADRERIAAMLHDEVVQTLSAAGLRVELVRAVLSGTASDEVDELQATLASATRELRHVMEGLRRPAVVATGLAFALRQRIAPIEAGQSVSLLDDLVREPPQELAIGLFWIAEECVHALRGAGGYGTVTVTLRSPVGAYELEVRAVQQAVEGRAVAVLDGARRLATLLGGSLTVSEPTPGITRILVRVAEPGA